MIKINKIADVETINHIVSEFSLDYRDDEYILGLFEQNDLCEFVHYSIEDEFLKIKFVSKIKNDFSFMDALMKTLIFYTDLSGLRYIRADKRLSDFAMKMNFEPKADWYEFDIFDMSKQKCDCKKEV